MTSAEMRDRHLGAGEEVDQRLQRAASAASLRRFGVDRADDEIAAAVVRDEAGLGHRGGDVDDRRQRPSGARGARSSARSRRRSAGSAPARPRRGAAPARARRLGVGRLDAEEHEVGAATAPMSVLARMRIVSTRPRHLQPQAVALDRLHVRRRGRSASRGGRRARAWRRRSCRRRRRRRRRWSGRTRSWQVPVPRMANRRGGHFSAGASSSRQSDASYAARTPNAARAAWRANRAWRCMH